MTYPKSHRRPSFPGPRPGGPTPRAGRHGLLRDGLFRDGLVQHGLGLALCLCALVFAPRLARGHDWYPAYCCSGQDCYEIGPEDVEFVGQGYFIKATGEYYPREAVPESPDGKFHRCSVQGKREARTLCLFAPTPAF